MKLIENNHYKVNGHEMIFLKYFTDRIGKFRVVNFDKNKEITIGIKDDGIRLITIPDAEIEPIEYINEPIENFDGCTDAFGMCYSDAHPGL